MTNRDVLAERYSLTRLLGRGGMGTVWAAEDQVLGRDVAVKVLNVVHAPPDALARFRREARLLAALAHPHIVTVFDFGADDERAWLVMELLPGPTLHGLLTDTGPLSVSNVAMYGGQCASALGAAHSVDVVHRDIKPANLMLAGDRRCKVLDLGIARLAESGGTTVTALTQAGMIVGTAPYVAPELVEGGPATAAVDTYALGAVLYALITGHPPFEAETALLTLAQHVRAPIPHPRAERPDTPVALDELVVDLLAKDPAHRPTAAQAAHRLDALDVAATDDVGTPTLPVGSVPRTRVLSAPSPTVPVERTSHDPRLTPRRVIAAVGVLLAALVAVWLAFALASDRSSPPSTAHQSGTATSTHTTSSAPPTTSTTTALSPIDALRNAVQQAAATGGLAAPVAKDLTHRVSDLSRTVTARPRKDFVHQVNDFEDRLNEARKTGQASESAYSQIEAALQALRQGSAAD